MKFFIETILLICKMSFQFATILVEKDGELLDQKVIGDYDYVHSNTEHNNSFYAKFFNQVVHIILAQSL